VNQGAAVLVMSVAAWASVRSVALDEFEDFFTGLKMLDPGAVTVSEWRRDIPGPAPLPSEINFCGAVALKPA
jgi:hypothetical protein